MYNDRTPGFISHSVRILVVFAAVGVGGLSVSQAQPTRQPRLSSNPADMRDAFARLPASVTTPAQLANYIQHHEELRRHYARLFGVSPDRVVAYAKDALVPYTLPKSRSLTTYGVTRSGTIYPVQTRLLAGSKVWATRDGVPVLKWNCSNPLVSQLPGTKLKKPYVGEFEPMVVHAAPPQTTSEDIDTSTAFAPPALIDTDSSTAVRPAFPVAPIAPQTLITTSSISPGAGNFSPPVAHLGSLWPVGLIPVGLVVASSGSHHPGTPSGSTAIPEAGTVCLFGCGIAAGSLLLARKRSVI